MLTDPEEVLNRHILLECSICTEGGTHAVACEQRGCWEINLVKLSMENPTILCIQCGSALPEPEAKV